MSSQEQEALWRKEIEADMAAAERVAVGLVTGDNGLPLVVCRDGSCHELGHAWTSINGQQVRSRVWNPLPPVPGSPAALAEPDEAADRWEAEQAEAIRAAAYGDLGLDRGSI